MNFKRRSIGIHPAWWTLTLVVVITVGAVFTVLAFNRDLQPYARVTLVSDRSGLVMDPWAKVKFHGVQVGRVSSIQLDNQVRLQLELYPDQLKHIPANIEARIAAPTAFGAKYVELITPSVPSGKRLAEGAVLTSSNVSVEVNTTFQNLIAVLDKIDVAKLNAVLSALGEAFRGMGPTIGQATTAANDVLMALNTRSGTLRDDYRSLKGFADTYGAAARDIVAVLDAASTTSETITGNSQALDSLLVGLVGLSNSGINLLGSSGAPLVHAINVLEPTTRLLTKYNPSLTCLLQGAYNILPELMESVGGHNGKSLIADAGLLLGDDMYRYPEHLPINGARGGPGGQPGCGSLPDVTKNFPVRALVTNTGWGNHGELRIDPGIGFPGVASWAPTTRGTPEPPIINRIDGPAPGRIPYPGGPPYSAPWYAPDGTPLYPGLPPAPPPMRAPEPGPPPPGSEPFVPAHPGEMGPNPPAVHGPPYYPPGP